MLDQIGQTDAIYKYDTVLHDVDSHVVASVIPMRARVGPSLARVITVGIAAGAEGCIT